MSESTSRARLPIGDYAASWYDDAPITDDQLSGLKASVENGELPSYSRFVMRKVLAEAERLHTWAGLMSLLDRHYPPDVFDGSSGDPGPRIIALTREVDQLRARLDEIGEVPDA